MAGADPGWGAFHCGGKDYFGQALRPYGKSGKSEYADWFLNEDALNIIGKIKTFNVFYQLLFWATILAGLWAAACRVLLRRGPCGRGEHGTVLYMVGGGAGCGSAVQRKDGRNRRRRELLADHRMERAGAPVLAGIAAALGAVRRRAKRQKRRRIDLGNLNGSLGTIKEKGGALLNQGKQAINAAAALQKPWSCPACGAQMEAERSFVRPAGPND